LLPQSNTLGFPRPGDFKRLPFYATQHATEYDVMERQNGIPVKQPEQALIRR